MNCGYLLSLGISFLLIAGFALALAKFIRRPTPDWLMILGSVLLLSAGILFMSLKESAILRTSQSLLWLSGPGPVQRIGRGRMELAESKTPGPSENRALGVFAGLDHERLLSFLGS